MGFDRDPKQIVTPYAFEVDRTLLGYPLATPKRRLAALLLGFLQIYWDANRQGIHDKIAGTVVVDFRDKRR